MIRNFDLSRLLGEPGPLRSIKLALIGLFVFDALFYLFAIGPLSESDRERQIQVANLARQVKERSAQAEKLAAIAKKVEVARTQGDQLLEQITLPRRAAFSSLVSELDQAGKKAGVELRDRGLNVEQIEGSDTLSMLTVTQGLEGNYENLVKFLNQLDHSSCFMIIESLGAAPQQQSGSKDAGSKLSVSVKLDVFVRES